MTIRADAHKPDFHRAAPPQLPVRCATTGSITISTGLNNGDTIDGITLATGDRVLVKDNGNATNGIYIVGASPARAFDFEEGTAAYGAVINVVVGTANASTQWRCTNTTVPTIGSTTLTFAEITGGAGGTVDIEDEGSAEGAADTIDFTGAGVSVSFSGGIATVDIPGGGGGVENPTYVQTSGVFDSDASHVITLGTAPTNGNTLLLAVSSRSRGPTGVTQTNVAWTQMVTNNANSQWAEVWIGVVSASAGTTITIAFSTNTTGQHSVIETTVGFSAVGSPTTSTSAGSASASVAVHGTSAGDYFMVVTSTNGATSGLMYTPALWITPSLTAGTGQARLIRSPGGSIQVHMVWPNSIANNNILVAIS